MRVPPPIITLVAIGLIFGAHTILPGLSGSFAGQLIIGGLYIVAGAIIAVISVRNFGKAKTTITPIQVDQASTLVTEGFYRFTRNPMYLGMALVIIGVGFILGTLTTIPVVIGFVWYMNTQQIAPEEQALEKIFGQDFIDYKSKVRRWI